MNIPIYKADRLDNSECVIGYYTFEYQTKEHFIETKPANYAHLIDSKTLKISFDNGKSFIKLSDLEVFTCTDFELKMTDMKMRNRLEKQPANGSIFTVITDKGR